MGAADLLTYSRTNNLSRDESKIKIIVDSNKEIVLDVQNRIRTITVEAKELHRLAFLDSRSQSGARTRIKRCNAVVRRFIDSVRYAESAGIAVQERMRQTLSSNANVFSATQIGSRYFLVKDRQIARLSVEDVALISGKYHDMGKSIEELSLAAKEAEEHVALNSTVLREVGEEDENPNDVIRFHDVRESMTISTIECTVFGYDTGSERSYEIATSESSSFNRDRGLKYRKQRNVAIAVAVIAIGATVSFGILYALVRR